MKEIIKADYSANSIASVVSILIVDNNPGMGLVNSHNVMLTGTVQEKLEQYKKATGKDWPGCPEQVYITPDPQCQTFSLNLGRQTTAKKLLPCDDAVQHELDLLSAQAKRYLAENEIAKKQPRERQLQFLSKEESEVV